MLRIVLFLLPCVFAARWTEFPSLSTTQKNLHSLTPSSLISFLKTNNLSVIWFHPKTVNSSDKLTYSLLRESFLTPAADRLQIPVAEYPINNDSARVIRTLQINGSDIDTIHIYSRLRRIIYYGLRTPDALVSFVRKLQCPKFTVIEGKADKKLFDLVDKVRVLAFVVPGSPFARAYANASLSFGPKVKFFVIVDPVVARRYALMEGSIQLHRPGEKSYVELVEPSSVAEIVSFVREEAGKAFFQTHRLNAENIHSFWREDPDQAKFVLLTSASYSPHSSRFHKLLRRSILNDTNCQISVIDVDLFPGMAEYWKKHFGVDASVKPRLGYVSLHNETALWLDQKFVNGTEGKESEQQNQRAISDFVNSIVNGSVTLKSGKRVDPDTGAPPVGAYGNGKASFQDDGDIIDITTLREDARAHEGYYPESEGAAKADRRNAFSNDPRKEWFSESDVIKKSDQKKQEGKPESEMFILEDGPVRFESPANKFGQDLTSFGSISHLGPSVPSVNAASKRHTRAPRNKLKLKKRRQRSSLMVLHG